MLFTHCIVIVRHRSHTLLNRSVVASDNGSPDCMAVYGWMSQVMCYWSPTHRVQGQIRREPRASPLKTSEEEVKSGIIHNKIGNGTNRYVTVI